jgi:hypothetical protein
MVKYCINPDLRPGMNQYNAVAVKPNTPHSQLTSAKKVVQLAAWL